jgi:hypothetical protein
MRAAVPLLLVAVFAATGCGTNAKPKESPKVAALRVVDRIVHNKYAAAWGDLHSVDQKVAPLAEYVSCEAQSPVAAQPVSVKVVSVNDESVGLGDGKYHESTAVGVRMRFAGGSQFTLTHSVHLVAEDGKWKWILPSWRYRDYRANRCPTNSDSTPPAANA